MKPLILLILGVLLLTAGCSNVTVDRPRNGVPSLTRQELKEILAQLLSRPTSAYERNIRINRESEELVIVDIQIGAYKDMELHFEKKSGKWAENKAKAEEIDRLIP